MFANDFLPTYEESDEYARRWFRLYRTFGVGSAAHVLVNGVPEQAHESAEQDRVP